MNGMERLLARIKALFASSPPESAPQQAEVTATPPVTVPQATATQTPEPTSAPEPVEMLPERPLADEPSAMAEVAPIPAEEASTFVEEAPADPDAIPADGLTLRLDTERGSRSTFQVTKSGATIGRGPESTIQLDDLSVSRKHARIAYRQGVYWLSDLGSMGGTWIDGTKLAAPRRVAAGQTIDIGVCRLVVVAAAEGEKTGAAKGPSNAA